MVVWLLGQQYQVELTRAHLPAVSTTWPKPAARRDDAPYAEPEPRARHFPELRRQVNRTELAHLDSFPLTSSALLDSLGRRYRLRVQGQPLTRAVLQVSFLNNEQQPLPAPSDEAGVLYRAVPAAVHYTVADAGLPTHQRSTVFKPDETRRAFARVPAACAPRRGARAAPDCP